MDTTGIPTTKARVDITFLRMDAPPAEPAPPLPEGYLALYVPEPEPDFYRYLQQGVGGNHLWWMRRHESDEALRAVLNHPMIGVAPPVRPRRRAPARTPARSRVTRR